MRLTELTKLHSLNENSTTKFTTGNTLTAAFIVKAIETACTRFNKNLKEQKIEVVIPDANLASYKEALIMAFIGLLRWRQEYNVLSSVTGSSRNSIGGALWTGQEA